MERLTHFKMSWDDPAQTILLLEYMPNWTWDQYFEGVRWILLQSIDRRIAIHVVSINNYRTTAFPRGDFFGPAREYFPRLVKNGCTVTYIRPTAAIRALIAIYTRISPDAAAFVSIADSVEEARVWIHAHNTRPA